MSKLLLSSTYAKINRAKKHLADLSAEITAYVGRNPYRIFVDTDSKPLHERYRFFFTEEIPCEWGSMVGDVIHNLRAALDTLATAMTVANGKTSPAIIKKTYFPIGTTKEFFDEKLPKDLRGASDLARKMVARLKPYKGGTDAFWRLHQLDIMDKHTTLIPMGASHSRVLWKVDFTSMFEMMGETDPNNIPDMPPIAFTPANTQFPLKNGDVVFEYGYANDPDRKHKGEFKLTIDVAFGEGQIIDGQPVIPSLQQFVDFIERIAGVFDRHLFK